MQKTLSIVALLAAASLSAQIRWDYHVGLRTPPPQGGMFGSFFNYQVLVKASPHKALGEKGLGRYALRFRTGPNSISYYQNEPSSNFSLNTTSMFGFERMSRPQRNLSSYWGAELGGSINRFNSTMGVNYLSYGPSAALLCGMRYKIKPRWTLALELAPAGIIWFNKSNGSWSEPSAGISLNGQTIGLSGVYML